MSNFFPSRTEEKKIMEFINQKIRIITLFPLLKLLWES